MKKSKLNRENEVQAPEGRDLQPGPCLYALSQGTGFRPSGNHVSLEYQKPMGENSEQGSEVVPKGGGENYHSEVEVAIGSKGGPEIGPISPPDSCRLVGKGTVGGKGLSSATRKAVQRGCRTMGKVDPTGILPSS